METRAYLDHDCNWKLLAAKSNINYIHNGDENYSICPISLRYMLIDYLTIIPCARFGYELVRIGYNQSLFQDVLLNFSKSWMLGYLEPFFSSATVGTMNFHIRWLGILLVSFVFPRVFPTLSRETSGFSGQHIKCFAIYLDLPLNDHMAKTCCCIRRAGNNCAIVPRINQESTNHSVRFVKFKSWYIIGVINRS